MFNHKPTNTRGIQSIIIVINIIASIAYFILGMVAFNITYDNYPYISFVLYTVCYLPFIFSVVLLVAYFISGHFLKQYYPATDVINEACENFDNKDETEEEKDKKDGYVEDSEKEEATLYPIKFKVAAKESVSSISLNLILFVMCLFTLLTLCYSLVYAKTKYGISVGSDTGFGMLDGKGYLINSSLDSTLYGFCIFFIILILLAGIVSFLLFFVRFKANALIARRLKNAIIIINIVSAVAYFILGIIAYVEICNDSTFTKAGYTAYTVCYLPFIFSIVLSVAYLALLNFFETRHPNDFETYIYDGKGINLYTENEGASGEDGEDHNRENIDIEGVNYENENIDDENDDWNDGPVIDPDEQVEQKQLPYGLTMEDMNRLERLNQLFSSGILSEDEYNKSKQVILNHANESGEGDDGPSLSI